MPTTGTMDPSGITDTTGTTGITAMDLAGEALPTAAKAAVTDGSLSHHTPDVFTRTTSGRLVSSIGPIRFDLTSGRIGCRIWAGCGFL